MSGIINHNKSKLARIFDGAQHHPTNFPSLQSFISEILVFLKPQFLDPAHCSCRIGVSVVLSLVQQHGNLGEKGLQIGGLGQHKIGGKLAVYLF